MKYFILSICIIICTPLISQSKKKTKKENYLHVQGGFIYDDNLTDKNYSGFNIVNLGWNQYKTKRAQSIELELIGYNVVRSINETPAGPQVESTNNNRSIELIYTKTYSLFGTTTNGLSLGPTASLLAFSDNDIPYVTNKYPVYSRGMMVGLGLKSAYNLPLSKKFLFNVNTRVTILDFGADFYRIQNPNIPIQQQKSSGISLNLFRNQFQLLLGVSYKI